MKLDDNFRVENDSNGFTLIFEQKYINKENKEKTKTDKWHYSSMKMILKTYVNESLKPCNCVIELHEKLTYLNDKIDKLK